MLSVAIIGRSCHKRISAVLADISLYPEYCSVLQLPYTGAILHNISGKTLRAYGIHVAYETVRKRIPEVPVTVMQASGYFVYDEQYVHINGIEKYRALLRDSVTGSFFEDILDDLGESTIVNFMINALSRFIIGMLLIMNMGEVPSGEKSSSVVDILLNSVKGAFLSRM